MLGRYEGDGYGGDAVELHDDALLALDLLDVAMDTGEGTFSDLNLGAGTKREIGVVEEHDTFIGDTGDTDEVFHLRVGDMEDLRSDIGASAGLAHHVAEVAAGLACHLEVGDRGLCGMNEDEVLDCGFETIVLAPEVLDPVVTHGDEILYTFRIEEMFQRKAARIGDTHGEPM